MSVFEAGMRLKKSFKLKKIKTPRAAAPERVKESPQNKKQTPLVPSLCGGMPKRINPRAVHSRGGTAPNDHSCGQLSP